jgi:hypothetical protein
MQTLQKPSVDHSEFDQLCDGVEEFEPLPAVKKDVAPPQAEDETLDGRILAGLITPL